MGHLNIVTYLVDNIGAKIDAQDSSGVTPLGTACGNYRSDIVMYLLAHGANLQAVIIMDAQHCWQHVQVGSYKPSNVGWTTKLTSIFK